MAGLQSGEGCRRFGTIHQPHRHTDSHVATAIAAPKSLRPDGNYFALTLLKPAERHCPLSATLNCWCRLCLQEEIVILDVRRSAAARRCRSQSPTTLPHTDTATTSTSVGQQSRQLTPRRRPRLPPDYFRRLFDTSGFDQESVRVSVERGTLVLGVKRVTAADQQSAATDTASDITSVRPVCTRTRYYLESLNTTSILGLGLGNFYNCFIF